MIAIVDYGAGKANAVLVARFKQETCGQKLSVSNVTNEYTLFSF
jgi:hypothetical protein